MRTSLKKPVANSDLIVYKSRLLVVHGLADLDGQIS